VLERAYEASLGASSEQPRRERGRRPMAVLEVLNKKGGGVFDGVDEEALLLFSAEVESLLRQKAVEATLMKRAYQERRRREAGIPETRRSAHAKIEGAILSQYAEFNTASRFLNMFGSAADEAGVPKDLPSPSPPTRLALPVPPPPSSEATGAASEEGASAVERIVPTGSWETPPTPPTPHVNRTSPGRGEDARSPEEIAAAAFGVANAPPLPAAKGGAAAGRGRGAAAAPAEPERGAMMAAGSAAGGAAGAAVLTLTREPASAVELWAAEAGLSGSAHPDLALMDWDLNIFDAPAEAKCAMLGLMYHGLGVCDPFRVDDATLRRFISAVRVRYKPNPFHNFNHAFSVAHVTYMILRSTRAQQRLLPLDVLAGFTAALCHDIDHPGNNNQFEVNSLSSLALQHSDDSVLERHHVHMTFRVLLRDDGANNIFRGLSKAQFREVRKIVIQ
ncbi:unnamed protein product, partial [Phaeothamnion confervicola]